MAEYDRERAITAGNAANVAGNIVVALIASGNVEPSVGAIVGTFQDLHVEVFNSNLALAGAESVVEVFETPEVVSAAAAAAPATQEYSRPTPAASPAGSNDPSTVVLKFGKHSGKTIAQVYNEDPSWLEWAGENTRNDFIKGRIAAFYASMASA